MAITILDKSAHQSFSLAEHRAFDQFFLQNLTPILVAEILADLSRKYENKSPSEEVVTLARKFLGSGPVVNADFRKLVILDLLGNGPPLTPQVAIDYGNRVQARDGENGLVIDLHPHNVALLRWRSGEFQEAEKIVAELWREASLNVSADVFMQRMEQRGIILPDVGSLGEAMWAIDAMLADPKMQLDWLGVLAKDLGLGPILHGQVLARWRAAPSAPLKSFAPYAHHCLRVMLLNAVATKNRRVGLKPTNYLDTQYLYYLPFCHIFCSMDKFHRELAPHLLRDDQSFVWAEHLKKALKRLSEWWSSLSDHQKKLYVRERGSYPPETSGCLVSQLWNNHCLPFSRRGSREDAIPDEVNHSVRDLVQSAEEALRTGKPMPTSEDGSELIVLRKYQSSRREIREKFGIELPPDEKK